MTVLNYFKKHQEIIVLLGILIIGIIVRLPYVSQSIWLDEAFSVAVAKQNLLTIPSALSKDTGPPLYYFLLHGWIVLWGASEVAIRSLSVVIGVLNLLVLYVCSSRVISKKTAFLALVLVGISPFHCYYSQTARPYILLALLSTWSLFYFWRFLQTRSWLFLGFINGLLLLTHYWGFFFVFAELCVLLIFIVLKKNLHVKALLVGKFIISFVFSSLLFLPWAPIFLEQLRHHPTSWLYITQPYLLLIRSLNYFSGGIWIFIIFWFLFGHWFLFQKNKKSLPILSILLVFFTLLIPQLIAFFQPIYLPERYDIIVLVPFLFFIASLLATQKKVLLTASMLCIVLASGLKIYSRYSTLLSADRIVAENLLARAQDNDLLIFTNLAQTPFQYYADKQSKKLVIYNFPSLIEKNSAHMDVSSLLQQRNFIEQEAGTYAHECKLFLEKGKSCYLIYYLLESPFNTLLLEAFEKIIGKPSEEIIIPERQQFYKEVIYTYTSP